MHPRRERSMYPIQVMVVYYSRFGAVKVLAEQIAQGTRQVPGVETRLLEVEEWPMGEPQSGETREEAIRRRAAVVGQLSWADALIVGSPGYFGSMASAIKRLFEECATAAMPPGTDRTRPWRQYLFRGKVGGAFTSTGTVHGGNEQTLHSILTMLMHLGMIVVTPGQQQPILENEAAPYGPTAIAGADGTLLPTEADQKSARSFGEQVAQVAVCLRLGQVSLHNAFLDGPVPGQELLPSRDPAEAP